jgi:hypothetical protein
MSIPLDRLYQYINNVAEKLYDNCVLIYHFWPHGSKNLKDLRAVKHIKKFSAFQLAPHIVCHDQEPLDYNYYSEHCREFYKTTKLNPYAALVLKHFPEFFDVNIRRPMDGIHDKVLLLHSEQRSTQVNRYQADNFITVYYWSHAIISLDWFRYAEHITQNKQVKKTFLIYNRAWSGTREYRLLFAELLIRLGLQDQCKTSVNPVEPELGIHYELHKFKNPIWRPATVLENYFPLNTAHSSYSADFDIEDYEATDIEVVLETLFDDSRLHLTEKSLRPIACAQPFILAGTQGSLKYLRSYGFKTFGLVWDERYDECADPEERLRRIADLMKQIANWTPWIRERKLAEARRIAEYNKNHFFSQEFFDKVNGELIDNLKNSLQELEDTNTSENYFNRRKKLAQIPELKTRLTYIDYNKESEMSWKTPQTRADLVTVIARAKFYSLKHKK